MEVKKGYKQTQMGMIPDDWAYLSIKELVEENIIEKPLDGNHGNIHPKSGDFVESGIPFIMANNVQDGKIDIKNCHFITKEQADRLQKGFSVSGDVLLTHKGTVGSVAIVGKIFTDYIMLTPQVTHYRVKDNDRIVNNYIKHFFESSLFQNVLKNVSGGGTRAYIGIISQQRLPFILPPKAEQTAITAALSDADALIQSLEKLIAKKRSIKQGAMQELLTGQTRLSGFTDKWKTVRLDEIILQVSTGLNPRMNFELNTGGVFYYVTIKNFRKGNLYLDDDCDKIDGAALALINARSDLRVDDIIFASIGRVGDAFLIKETPTNWNINESVFRLRPNKQRIIPLMLYHILTTDRLKKSLEKDATGSTFQSIKMTDLKATQCDIPTSQDEQFVIAQVLSDMDAEISFLETKLAKYQQIKEGMMQNLLTGKIRLA